MLTQITRLIIVLVVINISIAMHCMERPKRQFTRVSTSPYRQKPPLPLLDMSSINEGPASFKAAVQLCQSRNFVKQYLTNPEICSAKYQLSAQSKTALKDHIDLSFFNNYATNRYELDKDTHSQEITGIQISYDSLHIAISRSNPYLVTIYSLETKKTSICTNSKDLPCKSLAWSKNNRYLLGIFNNLPEDLLIVWDTAQDPMTYTSLGASRGILTTCFAKDYTSLVIVAEGGYYFVWHFIEELVGPIIELQYDNIQEAHFDPDDSNCLFIIAKFLAKRKSATRWALVDLEKNSEIDSDFLNLDGTSRIIFDHMQKIITTLMSRTTTEFILFDYKNQCELFSFTLNACVQSMILSHDRTQTVVKANNKFILFDIALRREVDAFAAYKCKDYFVAAHPSDLVWAVISSKPGYKGTEAMPTCISLRNRDGLLIKMIEVGKYVQSIKFTPSGRSLIAIVENTVISYPTASLKEYQQGCSFEQLQLLLTMKTSFAMGAINIQSPLLKEAFKQLAPEFQTGINAQKIIFWKV